MVWQKEKPDESCESARRRGDEAAAHFFIISTGWRGWWVSTAMARFIESELDRACPPEWVSFVDLSGSRVRVRTGVITQITESRTDQRAFDRGMELRMDRESESDDE